MEVFSSPGPTTDKAHFDLGHRHEKLKMGFFKSFMIASTLPAATVAGTSPVSAGGDKFNLRPYHVDLSSGVPRMLSLVNNTQLPEMPEYPGVGASLGIDLDVLKSLKAEWLGNFSWAKEQAAINK